MKEENKFYNFNPNIKAIIASNIRKYRKEKNLTQEELALYSEISYDFVRRIETRHGKSGFSVYTLYKISVVLGIGLDALLKEETTTVSNK